MITSLTEYGSVSLGAEMAGTSHLMSSARKVRGQPRTPQLPGKPGKPEKPENWKNRRIPVHSEERLRQTDLHHRSQG